MKRLRRALLEIWAILPIAAVVGFLGPFGTYLMGDFPSRVGRWWGLLMGAYILVRPVLIFWRWVARSTGLPRGSLVFWGMVFSSFPMALFWRTMAPDEMRLLGGYAGVLPFALLCALLIMVVVGWAERADAHLLRYYTENRPRHFTEVFAADPLARADGDVAHAGPAAKASLTSSQGRPRLYGRLSPRFEGDILALESEDHYVRVHGLRHSELLLLRLRDAIAEMDGSPGEQTHRSWWVARNAVAETVGTGRNREIRLVNGTRSPVARDSVERLLRSGFLPA